MDIQRIKELALANGFKLKEQVSGNMDLNAYVYDFANAIEREVKARAVPASINDIQSWIAVNSFSALDAADDNVPIVDANELAKYIDSLSLGVSVPEGFVLVKKVHPDAIVHNQGLGLFKECQVIYGWDGKSKDFKDALNKGFYHGVKLGAKAVLETAMIEAQEPAND